MKVEAGCSLVLKVKDENTLGKDSWQGLVKVPLKNLIESARSSKAKKEFKLTGFLKNGAKAQGVIYIEFAYRTKAELLSSDFESLDKGFLTRDLQVSDDVEFSGVTVFVLLTSEAVQKDKY